MAKKNIKTVAEYEFPYFGEPIPIVWGTFQFSIPTQSPYVFSNSFIFAAELCWISLFAEVSPSILSLE
jgi:hypothetical protein